MSLPIRILIVEDSEDDTLLMVRELRRSGYDLSFERVDTPESFCAALARQTWDLVIADYSMPHFNGLAALQLLQESGYDLPFIIVSGAIGEEIAVAAMKAGAHDYVMKGNLARLGPAVERELREAESRRTRRQALAELERRNSELAALNVIATTVTRSLDLEQVLKTMLDQALDVVVMDGGWAQLLDEEGTHLSLMAHRGVPPDMLQMIETAAPGDRLIGEAAQSGQPIIVDSVLEHPPPGRGYSLSEGMGAFAAIPLVAKDRVLGVLSLFSLRPRRMGSWERQLLTAIGHQVGIAIENIRLFEQLFSAQRRLRQMAQQVISAQEEERRRLSRELHDEAGQALTALRIGLQLIRSDLPAGSEPLQQRLGEAIALAEATMDEIRNLAQNLRPPALDAVGLSATLEGFCRDFAERTRLTIDYHGTELSPLPEEVNICLYRFVQEALTNVAKHAQATHVLIALRSDAEAIHLLVQDNGRGLGKNWPASRRSPGIGLVGMHDRLDLLGGWLEIESQPGQGTRLVAYIPWESIS
jgi:two-component system sensor histidine kinase UhpB